MFLRDLQDENILRKVSLCEIPIVPIPSPHAQHENARLIRFNRK